MTEFKACLRTPWTATPVKVRLDPEALVLQFRRRLPVRLDRRKVERVRICKPTLGCRMWYLHLRIEAVVIVEGPTEKLRELLLTERKSLLVAARALQQWGVTVTLDPHLRLSATAAPISQPASDSGLMQRIFWVDWRSPEDEIVESCEALLGTGSLRLEMELESDRDRPTTRLHYQGRSLPLALRGEPSDRARTIHALRAILAKDYEIRLQVDSESSDTIGLLPASHAKWREWEEQFGAEALRREFRAMSDEEPLFTSAQTIE